MTFVNFTYRNKIEGCLSNMSPHAVQLDGKLFSIGEAAFHYMKYKLVAEDVTTGAERKKQLLNHAAGFVGVSLTGAEYKAMGGKGRTGMPLTQSELAIWYGVCDQVQVGICKYKLENYQDVKACLVKTTGVTLVHCCRTPDSKMANEHWTGRVMPDGSVIGGNSLGRIWMSLRDAMK